MTDRILATEEPTTEPETTTAPHKDLATRLRERRELRALRRQEARARRADTARHRIALRDLSEETTTAEHERAERAAALARARDIAKETP